MCAEEDASMVSRTPHRSDISEPEDSGELPSDSPPADPRSGDSPLSLALSSWQDIVSAIELKFEEDMLPPSPRKRTCRVRDDSGFHQEEEDPMSGSLSSPHCRSSLAFCKRTSGILSNRGLQTPLSCPKAPFPRQSP